MDILKVEPGSSDETCPASSHDGDPTFDIKVEEGPVPITFEGIKAEHEVNSMCGCQVVEHVSQMSRSVYGLYHLCLSESDISIPLNGFCRVL
jgi:hypothetical protein